MKELKDIIIKVQSHSMQVSLELALLKKNLQVTDDTADDTGDDTVDDSGEQVSDTETNDENKHVVGGEEF